jgi:hypothetical protein
MDDDLDPDDAGPTMSVAGLPGGGHLVQGRGRLGLAAAITFRRLQDAAPPVRPVLVLDLGGTCHVHRQAQQALLALLVELRRRAGTCLVVMPRDAVSVLALAGMPFQPHDDLRAALNALPDPADLPRVGDPDHGPTAVSRRPPNARLVDAIARRRPSRAGPGPVDLTPGSRPAGPVSQVSPPPDGPPPDSTSSEPR